MNPKLRTVLMVILFIVGFVFITSFNVSTCAGFVQNREVEIGYSPEFKNLVTQKQIAKVTVVSDNELTAVHKDKTIVRVRYLKDAKLGEFLEANGVPYSRAKDSENGAWFMVIMNLLPILIIVGIMVFMMRGMGKAMGGQHDKAMQFGKSKAKLISDNRVKVTFKDVAGIDEALEDAKDLVLCLKEPKKFTRLGGRIPKGVLLTGLPGVGKTHLARAIAGEAGVPFYSISGSDFIEIFVGVGAARVRDLFEQAKKNSPCIIFIDEIDALGRHRGAGIGGGNDEREQTLNQLLVEMDGFEKDSGVIMIAATNRPDILDPALTRAGRFDKKIVVPQPDIVGREAILRVHANKVPLENPNDIKIIAKMATFMVGSDLENIINEAALIAARKDHEKVTLADLTEAYLSQRLGKERRSHKKSELEKEITAYHEAGHAIVAKILGRKAGVRESVGKVTILARGESEGSTWIIPDESKMFGQESQLRAMIMVNMGGRAAEALKYGEFSAGAAGDINHATGIATRMVMEFGMSKKLGPVALGGGGGRMPFVGAHMNEGGAGPSEETQKTIDDEVRAINTDAEKESLELLTKYRSALEATAKLLMEKETIDGEEIDPFIDECEKK